MARPGPLRTRGPEPVERERVARARKRLQQLGAQRIEQLMTGRLSHRRVPSILRFDERLVLFLERRGTARHPPPPVIVSVVVGAPIRVDEIRDAAGMRSGRSAVSWSSAPPARER